MLVDNTSKCSTDSFERTNNLSTLTFTKDDIAKITKNFNPNRVQGYGMISIRMLKICVDSVLNPCNLHLKHALRVENFPLNAKKQMSQFIHNKQLIENDLISLLPVCGKILERLIYNKMFECFT